LDKDIPSKRCVKKSTRDNNDDDFHNNNRKYYSAHFNFGGMFSLQSLYVSWENDLIRDAAAFQSLYFSKKVFINWSATEFRHKVLKLSFDEASIVMDSQLSYPETTNRIGETDFHSINLARAWIRNNTRNSVYYINNKTYNS
jgi:hypothetical protein